MQESADQLSQRLLQEFGKTRTNYNALVPRIVQALRLYRDGGSKACPFPAVESLDEILNDEALSQHEIVVPGSREDGVLVLCSERRALRSGGGGKYYFMDTTNKLVGCHKTELAPYAQRGEMQGPVLLKNLIFVFITRGTDTVDARAKSSNPQRLLEYYESLLREGKGGLVRRLVRVWSMEVFPEPPFDAGFPHCTLMWLKTIDIVAHLRKWRNGHWNNTNGNHQRKSCLGSRRSHQYISSQYPEEVDRPLPKSVSFQRSFQCISPAFQQESENKRRGPLPPPEVPWIPFGDAELSTGPTRGTNYWERGRGEAWSLPGGPDNARSDSSLSKTVPALPMADASLNAESAEDLFRNFQQCARLMRKDEIVSWSLRILDRLEAPTLEAAKYLITLQSQLACPVACLHDTAHQPDLRQRLASFVDALEEVDLRSTFRILLACLVQQHRMHRRDATCLPAGHPRFASHEGDVQDFLSGGPQGAAPGGSLHREASSSESAAIAVEGRSPVNRTKIEDDEWRPQGEGYGDRQPFDDHPYSGERELPSNAKGLTDVLPPNPFAHFAPAGNQGRATTTSTGDFSGIQEDSNILSLLGQAKSSDFSTGDEFTQPMFPTDCDLAGCFETCREVSWPRSFSTCDDVCGHGFGQF